MDNLLGVVLCGGESKRMGSDKGLLKVGDKTWAEIVESKLAQIPLKSVISINSSQLEAYGKIFSTEQLILDTDLIKGPLRGVLSVHNSFPEKDLLLMACDLLDIEQEAMQTVIASKQTNPGFDFYCYYHDGFFEPFCGFYTSMGLKKVIEEVQSNQLHNYSFQHVLKNGNTMKIVPSDIGEFKNRNELINCAIFIPIAGT